MNMTMLPKIHGHRGCRGTHPENTLPAIQHALANAADGVEVDLCVTRDDIIVLHHDLHLNPDITRDASGQWIENEHDDEQELKLEVVLERGQEFGIKFQNEIAKMLDQRIPIRELSLAELQQYNIGQLKPDSQYAKKFPEQISIDNAHIPTLDECANLFCQYANRKTILNLEIKKHPNFPTLTPATNKYINLLLKKLNQLKIPSAQILIQSFDWNLITQLTKQITTHKLNYKTGFTKSFPYNLTDIQKTKTISAQVFSCNYRWLTKSHVEKAHDLGLEIYVWTVNEKRDMEKMAEWGVDVITTDYPQRCRRVFYGEG